MININTLNELEEIGFGADIDELESYLYNSKQAQFVSRQEKYEFNYMRLSKILRELKPESLVFTDKNYIVETKYSRYSNLIKENSTINYDIAYGINSTTLEDFKENIDNTDIIALENIDGINISIIYSNGIPTAVYIIGESKIYNDITSIIKPILPSKIEELVEYGVVDCRAILSTIAEDTRNIAATVIRSLRNNDASALEVVYTDMYIKGDTPYNNTWDKIEYMRDLDFNVPNHLLIRNIQPDTLKDACIQFDESFSKDIGCKNGNTYTGITLLNNSIIEHHDLYDGIIYDSRNTDGSKVYKAIIRSINIEYEDKLHIMLNIVPTKANDKLTITEVEVSDISLMNEYNLFVGKAVTFYVAEGSAVIARKVRK